MTEKTLEELNEYYYKKLTTGEANATGTKACVIAAVLAHDIEQVKVYLNADISLIEPVVVFASMYGIDDILDHALKCAEVDNSLFYETMRNVADACAIAGGFSECYAQY